MRGEIWSFFCLAIGQKLGCTVANRGIYLWKNSFQRILVRARGIGIVLTLYILTVYFTAV
jgi:hypothetical protein